MKERVTSEIEKEGWMIDEKTVKREKEEEKGEEEKGKER